MACIVIEVFFFLQFDVVMVSTNVLMAHVSTSVNSVILFIARCSDGQYQCFDGSCIDLIRFCDFIYSSMQ